MSGPILSTALLGQNSIGPEKFNLKNPAGKEVVKELLDIRIEEEKWSNGHYNTRRVIVGSGNGTFVVGQVLQVAKEEM